MQAGGYPQQMLFNQYVMQQQYLQQHVRRSEYPAITFSLLTKELKQPG
jgi:hypothetical protein